MKKVTITIETDYIPAMALLKLAGVTGTGGQAGYEIESGLVSLDGTVIHEKRKGVSRPGAHCRQGMADPGQQGEYPP